jgi:hypothetical protein
MPIVAGQLQKQHVYQREAPLPAIQAEFAEIEALLNRVDARRKRMRRIGLIAILAGIACLIAGVVAGNAALAAVGVLLFIAGIVVLIASFIVGGKLVNNRRKLPVVKELLSTVAEDAGARAPFSVRLTFWSKPKLVSEQSWTTRKHGKELFLELPWIFVQGPLLDGCTVTHEITEMMRKRTYTNPRGKRKVKTRSRYLVRLRFAYPSDRYGDARQAQQALHENVRLPQSAVIRDVRVTEKAISMKAVAGFHDEIGRTARVLSLGAYRLLNLNRRIAAGRTGGAQ